MEFVFIEPLGAFVGKYEVTNGLYRRFGPKHDSGSYKGWTLDLDRQPVVHVSLEDAREFCRWMAGCDGIPAGYQPRLPAGVEWTRLAQCDDGRSYPWGKEWPPLQGNYADETADRVLGWDGHMIDGYDDHAAVTCGVEESGKNEWGLLGLGGNVWEWTEEAARDGSWRVLRGGSWRYKDAAQLQITYREKHGAPRGKDNNVGFRVVLSR